MRNCRDDTSGRCDGAVPAIRPAAREGREYRDQVTETWFEPAATSGDISPVYYDITALDFGAGDEDELRRIGMS